MVNPERGMNFKRLPMNSLSWREVNETVVVNSLLEYDKLIKNAYDEALSHSYGEYSDLELGMIPEFVKEERISRLSKKIEEYNNRLVKYFTSFRPMFLAPEQRVSIAYGERIRRGLLKTLIERGKVNTYLYYESLLQVEGEVNMGDFLASVEAINDYLLKGETHFGTKLPE